ncbi:TD and POZ domain-containing protein 1, partial [Stegodyphus mimosarum]
MLLFLYSEYAVIFDSTHAMKLYSVADKYDIPALKKKCSYQLKRCLRVKIICDVLQLADTHSDEDLFDSVFEYISAQAKEVFSSMEWKEFAENNTCAKLLQAFINHDKCAKQFT